MIIAKIVGHKDDNDDDLRKIESFFSREEANPLIINHYIDVIMTPMTSQITDLTVVYSIVYSGADQRKHQSSASPGNSPGPVNSPHKGPVTRKMIPFDDVIMQFV